MAGFADLGQVLAGNRGNNELAYAKGMSLGANTQNALAQARERVQKNTARDKLGSVMAGFGVHDPAAQEAFATAAQADIDPQQFLGARLKLQEADIRNRIATDPTVDDTLAQRLLLSQASGPVKPFESAGEGMLQNILHPELGVKTTALGDALVAQRTQSALLDEDKRLNPQRYQTASPFLVTPGGVYTKTAGPNGPAIKPATTPEGKPVNYAADVASVAGARTGATTEAKIQAETNATTGDQLADIDKFVTNVDNLLASPGFDTIYGLSSQLAPTMYIRGTDAANADALRKQIDAESFGVSVQKMRGLGALSDAEGKKVAAAFTRATNPEIGDEEARLAWGEVKDWLSLARQRVQQKAKGNFAGNTTSSVAGPPVGTVEDGYRFKGGNPADQANWEPVQ